MLSREEALQIYCAMITSGKCKLNNNIRFNHADVWKDFDIEYYFYSNKIQIEPSIHSYAFSLINIGEKRKEIKYWDSFLNTFQKYQLNPGCSMGIECSLLEKIFIGDIEE